MGTVVEMKRAPVAKRSRMDTLILNMSVISGWRLPVFQRPLHVNEKVRQIAAEIKADEVIPGVLTIGVIADGPHAATYIIDGQHRIEAFRMSDTKEAIADVRIVTYATMADMGRDFVELNSRLVTFKPDDVLRGLEDSTPSLGLIRKRCAFVGYGHVRRNGTTAPVLSMSAVLRAWAGSVGETPTLGGPAAVVAQDMCETDAVKLCDFLDVTFAAWGRGEDASRLWGNLNLSICMWLWRRLVTNSERPGNMRYVVLKPAQFRACLMSVGATHDYSDWLVGRNASDRDRGPCYFRLKTVFVKRMREDNLPNLKMPQPPWDSR